MQEAASKLRKGPSSEEIAKADKWEHRGSKPGRSNEEVKVFNKDGTLIAAQWIQASGAWIEIGEVTGQGDGGTVNGVYYDQVMPVEMETPMGVQTLQLGFNTGENPYVAANRFIEQNELGRQHQEEIAKWIMNRAGKSNTPSLGGGGAPQSSRPSSSSSSSSSSMPPKAPINHGLGACDDYFVPCIIFFFYS